METAESWSDFFIVLRGDLSALLWLAVIIKLEPSIVLPSICLGNVVKTTEVAGMAILLVN
jgi:heme exporter protein D